MDPEREASLLQALDVSAKRHAQTKAAHDKATERAKRDALEALEAGVQPSKVEQRSPFTGSYLRRLARAEGIEGDPRYDRTK